MQGCIFIHALGRHYYILKRKDGVARWVCQFSIASVINYHKLNGFNNKNLLSYSCGSHKSKSGLNSKRPQSCIPSGSSRGKSVSRSSSASRGDLQSSACGPFRCLSNLLSFLTFLFLYPACLLKAPW